MRTGSTEWRRVTVLSLVLAGWMTLTAQPLQAEKAGSDTDGLLIPVAFAGVEVAGPTLAGPVADEEPAEVSVAPAEPVPAGELNENVELSEDKEPLAQPRRLPPPPVEEAFPAAAQHGIYNCQFDVIELTLAAAIRMAVDNSETVRIIGGDQGGTIAAATAYDQAITNTGIQEEFGAFDPVHDLFAGWERIDRPAARTFDGAFVEQNQLDRAEFDASITKRMQSGRVASLEYDTRYSFFPGDNPDGFLNPQYFTPMTFRLVQPLTRDRGFDVNLAPLRIAKVEANQSAWDFKQAVLDSVRDVEIAYWQAYAAGIEVAALEEVVPSFQEVERINRERSDIEAAAPVDADQAASNLWRTERRLAEAKLRHADALNLLRNLINLPPTDNRVVVLMSDAGVQPIEVDREEAVSVALDLRPDVVRQRLAVTVANLENVIAKNQNRIRLDGFAAWRVNGLGNDLSQAWSVLHHNNFTDWELGFQTTFAIGRNTTRAQLRAARLEYQRQVALLRQTTHAATHDVAESIRSLESLYEQAQTAKKEVFFSSRWRSAARERYLNPVLSGSTLAALNNYLLALRTWADAKADLATITAQYNSEIASLGVATGTLLESRGVELGFDCCRAVQDILDATKVNGTPYAPYMRPHVASQPRSLPKIHR